MRFSTVLLLLAAFELGMGISDLAPAQTAAAPPAPAPDYMSQAISQSLTEVINQKLYWQAQALKAQAELAKAEEELAAARAPKTEPVAPPK